MESEAEQTQGLRTTNRMTRTHIFTLTVLASAALFAFRIAVTEHMLTYEQGGAVSAAVIGLLASLEV